jgi:hypothetical protein
MASFFTTTATFALIFIFELFINSPTFESLEDAVATVGRAAFVSFLEESALVLLGACEVSLADVSCLRAILALDRTAARLALLAIALALNAFFRAAAAAFSSFVGALAVLLRLCEAAFPELLCVF